MSEQELSRLFQSSFRPSPGDWHPSEEELADYELGDASDQDGDRIQAHLAQCRKCLHEYRLLQGFLEEPPLVDKAEVQSQWEVFREGIRSESIGRKRWKPNPGDGRRAWPKIVPSFALGTVFGILLTFLITSQWVGNQNHFKPKFLEVYPLDTNLQSGSADQAPSLLFGDMDSVVLLLNTNFFDQGSLERLEREKAHVEVQDAEGRVLQVVEGLELQRPGNFLSLMLSKKIFSPGLHFLVLRTHGEESPGARYAVSVQ